MVFPPGIGDREPRLRPQDMLEEQAELNKLVDSLGLVFDSDPRKAVQVSTGSSKACDAQGTSSCGRVWSSA